MYNAFPQKRLSIEVFRSRPPGYRLTSWDFREKLRRFVLCEMATNSFRKMERSICFIGKLSNKRGQGGKSDYSDALQQWPLNRGSDVTFQSFQFLHQTFPLNDQSRVPIAPCLLSLGVTCVHSHTSINDWMTLTNMSLVEIRAESLGD